MRNGMRALLGAALGAVMAAGAPAAAGEHILNMRDADIEAFIDDVSTVTGRTFVLHPQVKGKVTVISQSPLTEEEVFETFLSTLRVHGFTAIPTTSGAYRVVPENAAAEDTGIAFGLEDLPDDQFVTEVIRLDYADAREAAKVVEPLVNGRGQVSANPAGNVLVIADYSGNVNRVRSIVQKMDQDRSEILTIALKNMPAADMASVVNNLNDETIGGDFIAVPVERGNSILVRGEDAAVVKISQVIRDLDASSVPTDSLKVVYLRHATAQEIVPVLEDVARALNANAPTEGGGGPTITLHEPTNAVILSASPDTVAALERVIADLDIRRAQVLVEAIIVEISDDAARELGLQFFVSGDGDSNVPFATTNFSRSAPNVLALSGALLLEDDSEEGSGAVSDLTDAALASLLGIDGGAFGFGGEDDGTLFGVILTAIENDSASNVLSTPSILTLDNEPADILVGQEIPISTGEVLSANNDNPFRTIDRKEIGVMLKVTPQITEGDTIRLEISQEVSSLIGQLSEAAAEPVLRKRNINTVALADDGEVVVLGGLVEEDDVISQSKVPILGDLPVAGRLFRSEGRSTRKTNLMVFIRPTILRDQEAMSAATQRKYDFMRGEEALRRPDEPSRMDALIRAVVGPVPGDAN